ncbi:pyridoxamine 5'-phosphate oxidase [Spelaeicoccus albus]|uniref:Pyridoxine/pyridoxamine 5'-phosphate oxidase n=1 Tax=Spelaeicoccus albus TaxID=1280376 RepID=A0A7Z0D1A3_9MICO|nr:pyridoxamine 5'-phosphate oxidase [Spelaeicoccus albus]NYI65907.1 pyridoxamine 5'-phosphate oxidase [Spelaeicoccus albus]
MPHSSSRLPEAAGERIDYVSEGLSEDELAETPADQFVAWFHDAERTLPEPNAVVLATAGDDGPAARAVLLKDFGGDGFVVYTNYSSRKARSIGENPQVALLFPWHPIFRQVRVRGIAEKVDDATSDAYFASRSRGSQLSAWASAQSEPVGSRQVMDERLAEVESRFAGGDVPRPPFWGGYLIRPFEVEFWAGRHDRFHDRLVYLAVDGRPADLAAAPDWRVERRYP